MRIEVTKRDEEKKRSTLFLGIPRKGVIFLTVEDSLGQNKRPMGDLIKTPLN